MSPRRQTGALDKPEILLKSLADIPRLEGRLKAMKFKSQMETDIEQWQKQVEQLTEGCSCVQESEKLRALFQVVLDVGNALNAGTAKGNAIGFRMGTLLKLAELKASDKKTTLLHFTAEV